MSNNRNPPFTRGLPLTITTLRSVSVQTIENRSIFIAVGACSMYHMPNLVIAPSKVRLLDARGHRPGNPVPVPG
jgi:hypothetical protein